MFLAISFYKFSSNKYLFLFRFYRIWIDTSRLISPTHCLLDHTDFKCTSARNHPDLLKTSIWDNVAHKISVSRRIQLWEFKTCICANLTHPATKQLVTMTFSWWLQHQTKVRCQFTWDSRASNVMYQWSKRCGFISFFLCF